jgi:hypothetical protein
MQMKAIADCEAYRVHISINDNDISYKFTLTITQADELAKRLKNALCLVMSEGMTDAGYKFKDDNE